MSDIPNRYRINPDCAVMAQHKQNQFKYSGSSGVPEGGKCMEQSQQQQNSLELMVRAHARIRTLEEDNEILRMHVDLLTTDNKQLGQKVRKAEKEKTELLRINEALEVNIKSMQLKMEGWKVREQLGKLEKQNQLANQLGKNCTKEPRSQAVQALAKYQPKNNQEKHFGNAIQAESKNITKQYKTDSNYHPKSGKFQAKGSDLLYWETRQEVERSLLKNQSCYLVARPELDKINNKPQCRLYRNKSEPKQQPSDSYNRKQYKCNQSDAQLSSKPRGTGEQKIVSPLIRRNSPTIQKQGDCEFHPQYNRHAPSGSQYTEHVHSGSVWGSSECGTSKKFNYTNWRKTNNNLMVWKVPTGACKPIMINR